MINHNFAPCKYVISTSVPIHKGSNPKASESKDYQDVALSSLFVALRSLFSKILDNSILVMQSCSLIHFNVHIKKMLLLYNVHLLFLR